MKLTAQNELEWHRTDQARGVARVGHGQESLGDVYSGFGGAYPRRQGRASRFRDAIIPQAGSGDAGRRTRVDPNILWNKVLRSSYSSGMAVAKGEAIAECASRGRGMLWGLSATV